MFTVDEHYTFEDLDPPIIGRVEKCRRCDGFVLYEELANEGGYCSVPLGGCRNPERCGDRLGGPQVTNLLDLPATARRGLAEWLLESVRPVEPPLASVHRGLPATTTH